jgi:hypothetical protein
MNEISPSETQIDDNSSKLFSESNASLLDLSAEQVRDDADEYV